MRSRKQRPIGRAMVQIVATLIAHACWLPATWCQAEGEVDFSLAPVARIPAGTVVGEKNATGWNRVVLLATPRLAAGAVHEIPAIARDYATRFNVVIMARVTETQDPSGAQYQLQQVGVGYCTDIAGRQVVITSPSQEELGARLDTIERVILKQHEKVLDGMVQIVQSRTISMFDVEALVLAGGGHHAMLVRHLVWVTPETGRIAALIWPLATAPDGSRRLAGKSLSVVPEGFREDRLIHVSADELTLGIPSSRAFALARMPSGRNIVADPQLADLAARQQYDQASITQLLDALRRAF